MGFIIILMAIVLVIPFFTLFILSIVSFALGKPNFIRVIGVLNLIAALFGFFLVFGVDYLESFKEPSGTGPFNSAYYFLNGVTYLTSGILLVLSTVQFYILSKKTIKTK